MNVTHSVVSDHAFGDVSCGPLHGQGRHLVSRSQVRRLLECDGANVRALRRAGNLPLGPHPQNADYHDGRHRGNSVPGWNPRDDAEVDEGSMIPVGIHGSRRGSRPNGAVGPPGDFRLLRSSEETKAMRGLIAFAVLLVLSAPTLMADESGRWSAGMKQQASHHAIFRSNDRESILE